MKPRIEWNAQVDACIRDRSEKKNKFLDFDDCAVDADALLVIIIFSQLVNYFRFSAPSFSIEVNTGNIARITELVIRLRNHIVVCVYCRQPVWETLSVTSNPLQTVKTATN